MTLQAVFLDLGGTILDLESDLQAHRAMMRRFGEAAGLRVDGEALWRRFEALREAVVRNLDTSWKGDADVSRAVLKELLQEKGHAFREADWHTFHRLAWEEHLRMLRVVPETWEVLAALREAPVHTGILSDTDEDFLQICFYAFPLEGYFDSVTTSHEVGAAKPAEVLFQSALEKAGCRPAEAAHVGDSAERDARGARRVGMRSVLIDPGGSDDRADHVVPSLGKAYEALRPYLPVESP